MYDYPWHTAKVDNKWGIKSFDSDYYHLQDTEEETGVGRDLPSKEVAYFSLCTYQYLKEKEQDPSKWYLQSQRRSWVQEGEWDWLNVLFQQFLESLVFHALTQMQNSALRQCLTNWC